MLATLAVLMLATAPAPTGPKDTGPKTFGDWIAGCDNTGACQARALMPESTEEDYAVLDFDRGAGPGAQPRLSLFNAPEGMTTVKAGASRASVKADQNGQAALPAGFTAAVIAAGRRDSALTLADASGRTLGKVSLNGALAAWLYLDDRQGRVGTVTALVRPGPKPASAVPPPSPLPVVLAAPPPPAKPPAKLSPKAILALGGDRSCDQIRDAPPPDYARLDETHTLAVVLQPCDSGAYNVANAIALITDGKPGSVPAPFEDSGAGEQGEGDPGDMNARWNPRTRLLTTGMKGRSVGDCGAWRTYAWDGRRFRLVKAEEMGECRGAANMITTFRAAVRPR